MPQYAYRPSSDPYQDVQYHDASPDWESAARSTAMLANMFSQREQSNRAMDLEQTRMQMENSRANNAAVLDYMKQVRQDRLLESQQAMEMLKLGTEMREVNYRMDQAKKMDEAKWRARDARQQYFSLIPRMEQKLRERDLIGAEEDLSLAYQIPGISEDEFSVKHLGEVSSLMSKFTIDGKPAVQVLRGIKSSLQVADMNSPAWSEFKQLAQEFPTDIKLAAKKLAALRGEPEDRAELYENFFRQATNIMTPEKQAELDAVLAGQRQRLMQKREEAADSGDFDRLNELNAAYGLLEEQTKQTYLNGNGKYSPFMSTTSPIENHTYLTAVNNRITSRLEEARSYFDTLNGNLKIRAEFARGRKDLNSPEVYKTVMEEGTPAQKAAYQAMLSNPNVWNAANKAMTDVAVSTAHQGNAENLTMLDFWMQNDGKRIREVKSELDFALSGLLGHMSRIAASPGTVTTGDLQALYAARDNYARVATPFNGGVSPISGNFFEPNFVAQLERIAQRNSRAIGGVTTPMTTSSLTPAPASATPYPVSNKPR